MGANRRFEKNNFATYGGTAILTVVITMLFSLNPGIWLGLEKAAAVLQQQPNIVVIMADDLCLGMLNDALNQGWMPNLKRYIIDKGTTFSESFVSNSLCCPSRSTFLTGQYSHNHGVLDNKLPIGGVTKFKDKSTVATWLQKAGYRTGYVGKYLNGYGRNELKNVPSDNPSYVPPGWDHWQALVGRTTYKVYNYTISDKPTWLKSKFPALTPQNINTFQKVYRDKLESLRAVDDLIGNVVSALGKNRELANTVIVFTSDNGYLFGEHRLHAKMLAYEESMRVPLFIRTPGISRGRSDAHLIINNDLAPTIVELAGATPEIPIDGRSLIPILKNPSISTWRKRLLIEHWFNNRQLVPTYFALRTSAADTVTPNQLYVQYENGEQEFYDMASDPAQIQSLHNQGGSRKRQVNILQNRLAKLRQCKGNNCQVLEDR